MSRFFVTTRHGSIIRSKPHPKPYTEAWMQAREERYQRRAHRVAEQPRNERGFIVKRTVVMSGGKKVFGEILYDPGPIDRELYVDNKKQRDKESWEAPNA